MTQSGSDSPALGRRRQRRGGGGGGCRCRHPCPRDEVVDQAAVDERLERPHVGAGGDRLRSQIAARAIRRNGAPHLQKRRPHTLCLSRSLPAFIVTSAYTPRTGSTCLRRSIENAHSLFEVRFPLERLDERKEDTDPAAGAQW